MIKTRFRYNIILVVPLFVGIPIVLVTTLFNFSSTFGSLGPGIFTLILLFIAWLFVIVELRDKAIVLYITSNNLQVRRYLGFGKNEKFDLKDLDGFQKSATKGYNYIYIISGTIRIAKISSFYHSNFNEILQFSVKYLNDLGNVHTTISSEIKDAFINK